MIWVWLVRAYHGVVSFFVPPDPGSIYRMDVNQRCPACGHTNGKLQYIGKLQKEHGYKGGPVVQHYCNVCGFKWAEETISLAKLPLA